MQKQHRRYTATAQIVPERNHGIAVHWSHLGPAEEKKNFMEERHDLLKNVMGNTHAVITMNAVEQSHQEFEPDIIISDEASFFCDPEIQYATTTLQPADQILLVRDYKQLWPLAFTNEGQRI